MHPAAPPAAIQLPKYFYPKLSSGFFLFATSGLFAWISFVAGSEEWWGYPFAAFWAIGVVVGVILMFPGTTFLRLDEAGFTTRTMGKDTFIKWEDVDRFFVVVQSVNGIKTKKWVGMNFAPGYHLSPRMRRAIQKMADCEGMIDPHGAKAEDIVELMNQCRLRVTAVRGTGSSAFSQSG